MLEMAPAPYKIVQTAGVTFMLYERDTTYRQVYTDGRKLPDDPQPSWLGYSVGKWDGDSLVVDTIGFNDRGSAQNFIRFLIKASLKDGYKLLLFRSTRR